VPTEKNAFNREGFAEVVNSVATVGLCQLAVRFIELVAAAGCLALSAPMFLLVVIAIKLDSRGPILVRERRYGHKNTTLQVRKFRATTMSLEGKLRLTPVGQVLRQTGIEELPMLINVISGEMSIIGPPSSTYPTASLNERKPGITRWAQIFSLQDRAPD
jgi:putative colanic acid biosysnthesis UDP-glucose lipid carrier transferase